MSLPVSTYTSNTSEIVSSLDYGLKMAKSGFDVQTAREDNLLYNSSWPSLAIVKVTSSSDGSPIAHTLPYPTLAIQLGDTVSPTSYTGMVPLDTDSTYVYPDSPGTIVIYNLDISTDIDYPYSVKTQVRSTYNPDYGIKIVKSGSDIESNDLRDFILHTRAGSPMVLAVKTEETVSTVNPTVLQYTNPIGYPCFVFGYVQRTGGRYDISPPGGQAYPITFSDGTTSYIDLSSTPPYTGKASLVILRNPMFASEYVEATY
jgi:hypothetical protein